MNIKVTAALALFGIAIGGQALAGRDYISIAGSSTVYPFATVVAEQFVMTTGSKTPKIESTGTGGGFKLFCQGVGANYPDIANASRTIKRTELETCIKNGVKDIIEVKIGYDGIVLANAKSAPPISVSREELYLALAKDVPDPANPGECIANPYTTWHDINPAFPRERIEVFGPPPTSGTRDALVELVMEAGAMQLPSIKALRDNNPDLFKKISQSIREDGAYIDAGENDNLIVHRLQTNPGAFGIFGFSFLDQNADVLQGVNVEGVFPGFAAITDGSYPISRPLYLYVKKAHIDAIPGIRQYLAEFSSERAWGKEGYLADKGLVPMPDEEREKYAGVIDRLTGPATTDDN